MARIEHKLSRGHPRGAWGSLVLRQGAVDGAQAREQGLRLAREGVARRRALQKGGLGRLAAGWRAAVLGTEAGGGWRVAGGGGSLVQWFGGSVVR